MLRNIEEIHRKKNEDYASEGSPFENFERSAQVAEWFNDPIDKPFVVLISTKLARLATLLNKEEGPNNESVQDSFLDLATYCILWSACRDYHIPGNVIQMSPEELIKLKHDRPKVKLP